MMEYMEDKFTVKSPAMKTSDFYMEQVMESLDSAPYFAKSSPKCAQAFGLQSGELRASPCAEQSGASKPAAHSASLPTFPTSCLAFLGLGGSIL